MYRAAFFLAATFGLSALMLPGPILAEAALPAAPMATITVSKVSRQPMTERLLTTGLITPIEEVLVQPLIEGQPIEELHADIGDMVSAGQVLAILSKDTLVLSRAQSLASEAAARATIAQAEAQLIEAEASGAEAQRVADRTNRLKEQGTATQAAADTANASATAATARVMVARQALEAATAQLALAQAQLANVDLMLTRTEVRAPYAGRITARNAVIGAIASAQGAPMFVLEKDGALELRADLAEKDILRVENGQAVNLRAVGYDTPFVGIVRLVEPGIDTNTRLGRARISLDQATILRAGMFVEAEIIISHREALAVPITALRGSTGTNRTLKVTDGLVEEVPLTTGIRERGLVEVQSGLNEGDLVVTRAGAFVRPGDHINPHLDTPMPQPQGQEIDAGGTGHTADTGARETNTTPAQD